MLWLALPLSVGGCATKALWGDDFKEPLDPPGLQIFCARDKADWLVVYNEYVERGNSVRPRAYFLKKNEKRIAARHRPRFVTLQHTNTLEQLPSFSAMNAPATNDSKPFFVMVDTNYCSFILHAPEIPAEAHSLPVYNPLGTVAKVVLTPFAVTADVTFVSAAFVAVVGIAGVACEQPAFWFGFHQ